MLTFLLKESFLNPTGTLILLPVFVESQVGSLGLDCQSRKFASVDETESGRQVVREHRLLRVVPTEWEVRTAPLFGEGTEVVSSSFCPES